MARTNAQQRGNWYIASRTYLDTAPDEEYSIMEKEHHECDKCCIVCRKCGDHLICKSCNPYSIINTFKSINNNKYLQNCFKAKLQISKTPKHLLPQILKQIMEIMFNAKDDEMINFLIQQFDNQKLQKLNKIIKNVNINYQNKKHQHVNDANDNEKPKKEKMNNFDKLSNESISNIGGFLDNRNIDRFKTVSRRMAIISLQEMLKYKIGVFNMNELINPYYTNNFKITHLLKYNRYHAKIKLNFLKEKWSQQYHINQQNQLLFPIKLNNYYARCKNEYIIEWNDQNIDNLEDTAICDIQEKPTYLLFDKREMVTINHPNKANIMSDIDNLDTNNRLIILQYFDIGKESVYNVQNIMIDKMMTYQDILDYIEYRFISRTQYQTAFHKSLINGIKKTKCIQSIQSNESSLCIYHRIWYHKYKWQNGDEYVKKAIHEFIQNDKCMILIFSLNPQCNDNDIGNGVKSDKTKILCNTENSLNKLLE